MVVIKRNSPSCKLRTGDTRMKKVKQFKYLQIVFQENGKCGTEIGRQLESRRINVQILEQTRNSRTKLKFSCKRYYKNACRIIDLACRFTFSTHAHFEFFPSRQQRQMAKTN